MGTAYSRERLIKESTEVTLDEGDILYHPAGIWHSVLSLTDSYSINFSLRQQRMADVVTNAVKMHLLKDINLRRGVRHSAQQSIHSQLTDAIKAAQQVLANLKPEHILVPSLAIPRAVYVDVDIDKQADGIKLTVGQKLKFSKLY